MTRPWSVLMGGEGWPPSAAVECGVGPSAVHATWLFTPFLTPRGRKFGFVHRVSLTGPSAFASRAGSRTPRNAADVCCTRGRLRVSCGTHARELTTDLRASSPAFLRPRLLLPRSAFYLYHSCALKRWFRHTCGIPQPHAGSLSCL